MTIGQQIKSLREEKGWSQGHLAREVKTSQAAISMAESEDYKKLTISTVERIAKILGRDVTVELVRP